MVSQDKKPAKESYHSPEFLVYGDILELTQTVHGMLMQTDSAMAMGRDKASA